jgi:hypothetical protein
MPPVHKRLNSYAFIFTSFKMRLFFYTIEVISLRMELGVAPKTVLQKLLKCAEEEKPNISLISINDFLLQLIS